MDLSSNPHPQHHRFQYPPCQGNSRHSELKNFTSKLETSEKMSIYYSLLWISFFFLFLLIQPSSAENGNSLESCKKVSIGQQQSTSDMNLICNLRTLNGDFDKSNFSTGILIENVVSLELACSDIHFYQSSLQPGSLAHLSRLGSLHIEHCKLSRLPPGVFSGLLFLRNLTIRTHNTAWPVLSLDIGPGVLGSMTQLERIDLSANNIWTFPDKLFCPATSLEYLNVSLNRLQDVSDLSFREKDPKDMSSTSSSGSNGAEGQKLIGQQPSPLSTGPSACKLGIKVLDISRNRLILLPAKGFGTLSQLKELYLQGNEISIVAERALGGLNGLRVINLSDNKIQTLPEELFLDTPEITEIYLQNNSLAVLAPRLFTKLVQLVTLDLSSNALTSDWMNGEGSENDRGREDDETHQKRNNDENEAEPQGTFSGLIRLILLNLGRNKLTRLIPESFRDMYSLQSLNLERNYLESIDGNTFSAMKNLNTLILSHNSLTFIDSISFNGLFVLSLLSLDNNNISDIHPAAFHNCSSLKDLNINGNALTEIPIALQNITLLRTVDLGENSIDKLDSPPKLIGLPNLYGLRLTGNKIVNVSKDALKELPALKILNLARNMLSTIEPRAFDANTNLQATRLDANFLTDISDLFAQSPSMIWLNVSDNQLTWFDYALIPQKLQWLDLHMNKITELGNFYNRPDLRLQTLDASFNRISRIGSGNIPDSAENVFINDNLISHVEPHTFFKKANLSRVDIFANQIETLELSSLRLTPFPDDKMLPEFYIGGNPFLCNCNMDWLQRINKLDNLRQHPKVMDLDSLYCKLVYHREKYYVPLTEADPSQFLCPYQTHCFHLCHCCEFHCDCLNLCPDNCTCYHDDMWSVNIADCASRGHTVVPAKLPMDATHAYLDGNFFEELPSHVFIARKNLQVLYLNHSGISVIGNNSFSGLKRLAVLQLESNFLTELRGYEFEPLESLRELYLQSNQIRFIANHTFLALRGLEVLQLAGNQLTQFAVWTLSQNPYLVDVALDGNPWSCACDFVKQAAPWIRSNVAKLLDSGTGVNCQLNGKSLSLVYMNGTKCSEITALSGAVEAPESSLPPYWPLIGGVMTLCLVIGMILLALCRKRTSLRVWATSKCPLNQCYQSALDSEDREKLFDAYVFYNINDSSWVCQIFASELTQCEKPLRLLLHYKEFGATSYISDTIVEAVESSKRTIIVLSKNFIQSEWARFEFKSALHAALRGKKNRLIAVTLGDLPTRDLDPDLRVTLRSATILSANDKLFWAKLKCALPDPRVSYSLNRSGGFQSNHHNSHQHHSSHQSHPMHHGSTGLNFTSNGTLGRSQGINNGGSLSNCNSLASTPNSGPVSASVPLYVPPFPPPNRPPPPFPTPRRPPPPAPVMWG